MRRLFAVLGLCTVAACAPSHGPGRQYVVFFGQGSATLDATGQSVVSRVAKKAKKYSDRVVDIEGYARQNGDLSTESLLAAKRARAVAEQLVADGVDESRIRETTRPPSNAEGTVGARRVEIELLAQ